MHELVPMLGSGQKPEPRWRSGQPCQPWRQDCRWSIARHGIYCAPLDMIARQRTECVVQVMCDLDCCVTDLPRARLMDVLGSAVHPLRVVRGHPHHHADGERRVVRRFPPPCCVRPLRNRGAPGVAPSALLLLPADRRRQDQEGQGAQGAQNRRRAAAQRVPGPRVPVLERLCVCTGRARVPFYESGLHLWGPQDLDASELVVLVWAGTLSCLDVIRRAARI